MKHTHIMNTRPIFNLTAAITIQNYDYKNTKITNYKITPQIQRGFPADIVRNTNLLTCLFTYLKASDLIEIFSCD